VALAVVGILALVRRRRWSLARGALAVAATVLVTSAVYHTAASNGAARRWLTALDTPLVAVFLVVVLPAMCLPRNRWYRLFLLVPAAFVALAVLSVLNAYRTVPAGAKGFYWFLVRPGFLIAGVASLLVMIQPLLGLAWFRRAVRLAAFLVLVYGGFALRQNYEDYTAMRERRPPPNATPRIMNVSETSPVLQSEKRMTYIPGAPCRFTADGGYVQGCNMEMAQRLMQIDFTKIGASDPGEISLLAVLLGALLMFLIVSFITARWWCGWVCPLSTLGGVLDWVRRRLRLPHLKPSQPVKLGYLFSGIGLGGLGLAMARAYPNLDANGQFLGCSIPLYPFCKICPSQQVCPIAATDPYPGLPTWDWGFGFFKVACVALLAVFGLSFLLGRRLWCRLCPMGMISGLFNRGGLVRLVKDPGKCNRCGVCAEVCPMDIDRVRAEMTDQNVSCFDCVLCLRCIEKCPRDGCLALEHAGARVVESHYEGGKA